MNSQNTNDKKAEKRIIYPDRIIRAREEKGMNQTDFAKAVMEETNTKFSKSYISLIESGTRKTPDKYIDAFCKILGVTEDYLAGKTSDFDEIAKDNNEMAEVLDWRNMNTEIKFSEVGMFEGQPICITWNATGKSYWGIVCKLDENNKNSQTEISTEKTQRTFAKFTYGLLMAEPNIHVLKLTPNMKEQVTLSLWNRVLQNYRELSTRQLSLKEVRNAEKVYVRMRNVHESVTAMYDGWYKLNENKSALINEKALILPLTGFGTQYNCYSAEI